MAARQPRSYLLNTTHTNVRSTLAPLNPANPRSTALQASERSLASVKAELRDMRTELEASQKAAADARAQGDKLEKEVSGCAPLHGYGGCGVAGVGLREVAAAQGL